jgi:protocatechuate 3,4-dioxygenase alpha subunit
VANSESRSTYQATVSQTIGPYFRIGLARLFSDRVAESDAAGRHIAIVGCVLDGDGAPVSDALIEVWQADANGTYAHPDDPQDRPLSPGFRGYARVPTDDQGRFRFATVKPGCVPAPGGGSQAPHILVALFMRGFLRHAVTRIYFADEPANADDPVLRRVPAARRDTLVAKPVAGRPDTLEWNILLQGPHETVFFDC